MGFRIFSIFAAPALLWALLSPGVYASTVERLIMPGDLIRGHAKYEDECAKCHKPFSKVTQTSLCLDCHKEVKADYDKKKGYHGLSKEVQDSECRRCHTDHKGRGTDVVRLDKELFDHDVTDYKLKGGHLGVKCAKCHKPGKKYTEAPSSCIGCHRENDVHKKRLGEKCADCHDEREWRKARFDHEKTKFKLKGKHNEVSCVSCHPNEKYKDTPKQCLDCHRLNDVHAGRYGKKCDDCHTQKDWEKAEYDHKKTKFPLKGAHEKVKCSACHTPERPYGKKIGDDCYTCHKKDDTHSGRYGKKCADCHSEKGWEHAIYDHGKTKFPLRNRHEKVSCAACHRGNVKEEKLPKDCYGCHKHNDAHAGKEGKKCERCHNDAGWKKNVVFDHDITKFPLVGLHAVAPCEACHSSTKYVGTKRGCLECHEKNDDHKGKLGEKCERCHNPNGWKLWRFDHDRGTDFRLEGAHKGIVCVACHREPVKKEIEMSGECYSCHRQDDEHREAFGLKCDRCHTVKTFREIKSGSWY